MRECLDKQTLIAFACGDLADDASAAAEAHLEVCGRCAKALARLDVGDDLVARLRDLDGVRTRDEATSDLLRALETHTTSTLFGDAPVRPA
jgi:anti-sigma factor RsiW